MRDNGSLSYGHAAHGPAVVPDLSSPIFSPARSGGVPAPAAPGAMTPQERRASLSLAFIFALRMLGLFLVLPVFALEARHYAGGDDPARVGLAMGIYGLTQALLQIPFGMASDRLGRKRVIVAGLLVFAAGSVLAALADSLAGLTAGRALQGAGAVSAAVTALLADQTREAVRTKGMALVGMSIGLVFAISLVAAPALAAHIGLSGLFWLTAVLALVGVATVVWLVPPEPRAHQARDGVSRGRLRDALRDRGLLRLDAGVFALHTIQMSMWVAVPGLLVQAGLDRAHHWQVYLTVVLVSFVLMGACLFPLERRGYLRAALLGAIGLVLAAQLGLLGLASQGGGVGVLGAVLVVFFCGFNMLEASQPSLVSRLAPAASRGAALGVYNTLQSLGLFAGGALGGTLFKLFGVHGLFGATSGLCLLWLAVTWGMAPVAGGRAGR